MAIVKFTRDPANPPKLSAESIARLDALTPEQIEENARTDPDNPPFTEAELDLMTAIRRAKAARAATGLSQAKFAETFHINLARLKDLEQGRFHRPDSALVAYLTVIGREPEAVRRALTGEAVPA
jgi:putative transcriptional regulator